MVTCNKHTYTFPVLVSFSCCRWLTCVVCPSDASRVAQLARAQFVCCRSAVRHSTGAMGHWVSRYYLDPAYSPDHSNPSKFEPSFGFQGERKERGECSQQSPPGGWSLWEMGCSQLPPGGPLSLPRLRKAGLFLLVFNMCANLMVLVFCITCVSVVLYAMSIVVSCCK